MRVHTCGEEMRSWDVMYHILSAYPGRGDYAICLRMIDEVVRAALAFQCRSSSSDLAVA